METRSQSKGDPTRPIGSKLKKKHPAAKDSACAVVPDSFHFSGSNNSTVVTKIKDSPDAAAVPTGSSGNVTLEKPDAAVVTSGCNGNKATIASTQTLEKPVTATTTITASDPCMNETEYISSQRRQFYASHHHYDTTLSAVSSKIQY